MTPRTMRDGHERARTSVDLVTPEGAGSEVVEPKPLSQVVAVLRSAWPMVVLLIALAEAWLYLPTFALTLTAPALFALTSLVTLVVSFILVLYRMRYQITEAAAILPGFFLFSGAAFAVCLVLATADLPETSVRLFQWLMDLLARDTAKEILVAGAYVALALMGLFWGLLFAVRDQLSRLDEMARAVSIDTYRMSVAEFFRPIGESRIPITSILAMRKGLGGVSELTIRVAEPSKVQDSKGEWTTVQREKIYAMKMDVTGRILSVEEQTKKS